MITYKNVVPVSSLPCGSTIYQVSENVNDRSLAISSLSALWRERRYHYRFSGEKDLALDLIFRE